jgi:hypothetical protein
MAPDARRDFAEMSAEEKPAGFPKEVQARRRRDVTTEEEMGRNWGPTAQRKEVGGALMERR